MNFENINSRLQEIWNTTPANFWWVLIVLVIALLIFFLPVKIASSRGLSGGQIFGVFLATIFGFWFLGLILALVLPRSVWTNLFYLKYISIQSSFIWSRGSNRDRKTYFQGLNSPYFYGKIEKVFSFSFFSIWGKWRHKWIEQYGH